MILTTIDWAIIGLYFVFLFCIGFYFARRQKNTAGHKNPFGKGMCTNNSLIRYSLHYEFKTDVAKISFGCNTSDYPTMLSVMYALLNTFAHELNKERRDIKACLT